MLRHVDDPSPFVSPVALVACVVVGAAIPIRELANCEIDMGVVEPAALTVMRYAAMVRSA